MIIALNCQEFVFSLVDTTVFRVEERGRMLEDLSQLDGWKANLVFFWSGHDTMVIRTVNPEDPRRIALLDEGVSGIQDGADGKER